MSVLYKNYADNYGENDEVNRLTFCLFCIILKL